MIDISEVVKSTKRYFRYVWDWKEEEIEHIDIKFLVNDETGNIGEIISQNILSLPLMIVVGKEHDFRLKEIYEDSDEYLKKITEWKFLYKLFPERIGYVSAPFKPELMWIPKQDYEYKLNLENIKSIFDTISRLTRKIKKNLLLNENLKDPYYFIKIAGRYFTTEDMAEKYSIGHETAEQSRFLHQMSNLLAGLIKVIKNNKNGSNIKHVLIIDNNIKRYINEIDTRFKEIFKKNTTLEEIIGSCSSIIETYYYDSNFNNLYSRLSKVKKDKEFTINVKKNGSGEIVTKDINKDFECILVDIFLGEDVPSGIEIMQILTSKFPHVPSFALSVSDDFSIIKDAIKEGADYYILKNQIFSLPFVYYTYIEELGKIILYLKENKYKKNLIGNIRYWKFKKNLLCFGDKCYHMIDHSYKHTLDDWNYMNQVLIPLIKEKTKQGIFGEDDDLLYAFCMAIWLHDIGHKGNDNYGEPHLIRDNHGYLSGELILRYPEIFRIKDLRINEISGNKPNKVDVDDYYDHNSIDFSQVSAIEMIYNRELEKLTTTEMIALIAMYHKSNTPLDWTEYKKLMEDKKSIPLEYFIDRGKNDKNILTLERVLNKRLRISELKNKCENFNDTVGNSLQNKLKEKIDSKERFLTLTALFRFIDSIDIRSIRVGGVTEKELKETVIKNDAEYQFKKMKTELFNLLKDLSDPVAAIFVKTFYQDVLEKIKSGEFTQLNLPDDLLKDGKKIINYKSLVDYASFIALQPTHFNLHSSVKKIDFIYKGNLCFDINLTTDKEVEDLEKMKVRERGKKEQSVYDRIIGKNCYIKKELEGAKHILKQCLNNVKITLINTEGKVIDTVNWSANG